ncbi:MAG: hypothetical protein JNJ71_06290 [Rubrivivax sp.]|nr:hypothetical protein [Rubrivivax sp.]
MLGAPGWASAAETGAGAPGLGPWLFACVALIVVAVLGWMLGRRMPAATKPLAPPGQPPSSAVKREPPASAGRASASATVASAHERDVHRLDDAAAFSYALSHDLRAPLRVMEGFARILKEDYGRQLDRIGNDHIDRMLGASMRMNSMIDAMLSLAQLSAQPLQLQPVDLSQMALSIVEDLRQSQPARTVQVDIEPGLRVQGDALLLRQMLENLLGNAWKYTGKTAQPQIRLRALAEPAPAGLRRFEVSDNGAGFDVRSAARLFGLFQRLHASSEFPGTGIGLASVLRIVHRHGGEIRAEAEPGRGARFSFTLPG